jgi:hypothetical protein
VRARAAHDRVAGALIDWSVGGERCFHCNRIWRRERIANGLCVGEPRAARGQIA